MIDLNNIIASVPATESIMNNLWSDFKFGGKSLSDWDVDFFCPLNNNPTPEQMRTMLSQAGINIQTASNFFSMCTSILEYLSNLKKKNLNKEINTVVEDYKQRNAKRPAKDIVEALALNNIEDLDMQIQIFTMLKSYWRDKRDSSVELRKILEQIHISTSVEIKYLVEER